MLCCFVARASVAELGLPRGAGGRALYGYHSFDAAGCLSKARGKGSEMLLCLFGAARNATPYPRSTYQADVAATA